MSDYVKDEAGNLVPSKEKVFKIVYNFWKDLLPPPRGNKIFTASSSTVSSLSKSFKQFKDYKTVIYSYLKLSPNDIAFAHAVNLPMDSHLMISYSQVYDEYMDKLKSNYDEYKYLFIFSNGFNSDNPLRAEIVLNIINQRITNNLYTIIIYRRVPGQIGCRPKALRSMNAGIDLLDLIGEKCSCILDTSYDTALMQDMDKLNKQAGVAEDK